MVVPHLLYPDVQLHNPRLRIHLYLGDAHAGSFGASSVSPSDIEIGVLNRACVHAGVSSVEKDVLNNYRACVEGPGFLFRVAYDPEQLEFKLQK